VGDAGSGYWFGRAALDAAMRSYDGRGPATVLLDRLRAEFGDVEGAYIELQADPARIRRTASFSRWVTEAESAGDAVAAAICREGAAELAHSVASGLDRVGTAPDAPTPVCTIGGVFRSAAIATAFSDDLRARRPAVRILAPRGDGLDGAAALLTLAPASPLTARVTRITLP
ncbi:MAG: BadF/BadG/BcrA/BcrD ATPase family protein, partial [Herbiconiux sp.]|nr:BadF/BadG/BcrA/BcrD ATPase family protein [Herbiconiux sp.]